jgi:hypothetical protein
MLKKSKTLKNTLFIEKPRFLTAVFPSFSAICFIPGGDEGVSCVGQPAIKHSYCCITNELLLLPYMYTYNHNNNKKTAYSFLNFQKSQTFDIVQLISAKLKH